MSKDYVILARNPETKHIAFATPKAFSKIDEAKDYAKQWLDDVDWLVVHSLFAEDVIEHDMWKVMKDDDVWDI